MEQKPDQKTGVSDYFKPQSQKEINQTVKEENKNQKQQKLQEN